ncbi:MAG: radical SAM protein [Schaedlerella sp.]|nr:radical SAM protein [Schaedlerella sp.]
METIYDVVEDMKEILLGERMADVRGLRDVVKESVRMREILCPPQYVMMKITNCCNSDCVYCNHAVSKQGIEEKSTISVEKILEIVDQAAELGVKALSLSGGEPLVTCDIEKIVERIVSKGIVPVMLTNGLLLEEKAERLYEAGLKYFIISIDSLDEEAYRIQRGASLKRALKGIDKLLEIKEKDENVRIHITPVLTQNNLEEMPEFIRYFSEKGVAVQLSPYHQFDKSKEDILSIQDIDKLKEVIKELISMKKNGALIANSEGFLKHFVPFFEEKKVVPDQYKCLSGYISTYIDAYANVRVCWSGSFGPVENLYENTLSEIWYGEKYQKVRERMVRRECEGCWFLCTGELTTMIVEGGEER